MTPDTTDETETETTLTLHRTFDTPPERVFDAWIDPETVRQWLFTTPETNQDIEIDARVGGSYTITDRRGGEDYTAVGEYEEIDRPNRLVFTFVMPQFSPDEDRIVVEFEADGDGCVMTFTQEGLSWPPEQADEYKRDSEEGWVEMFDLLETRIEPTDE